MLHGQYLFDVIDVLLLFDCDNIYSLLFLLRSYIYSDDTIMSIVWHLLFLLPI